MSPESVSKNFNFVAGRSARGQPGQLLEISEGDLSVDISWPGNG